MPKIQSTKALNYDPIKPQLSGVIGLEIIEVKDYLEQGLTVITVRDTLIETGQVLAVRNKTFTFEQVDDLSAALWEQIDTEASYMERRLQLLQAGLLLITQTDEFPLYFSTSADWELVPEAPEEEVTEEAPETEE